MTAEQRRARRAFFRAALGLASLASAGALSRAFAQEATRPRPPGAAGPAAGPAVAARNITGTQLVLLGTRAGPGVDFKRAQTASAILVDGVPYLVDCGYGTVRNLVAANINGQKIEKIVFTHLHNDHTSDVPALFTLQWTGGRTKPIDLYGPYGTASMVRAAVEYCKADEEIRTVDEGRTVRVQDLYKGMTSRRPPNRRGLQGRARHRNGDREHPLSRTFASENAASVDGRALRYADALDLQSPATRTTRRIWWSSPRAWTCSCAK